MLRLAATTDPAWAPRALAALDDVLTDHAHCEKRAASTAIALIFRYPDHPSLAIPLSRLAREELAHFEEVVLVLRRRGRDYRRIRPAAYAGRLSKVIRNSEPHRALDSLIVCAFIEARSCERMTLFAEALEAAGGEDELVRLYRGLLAAEARHHEEYLEMARELRLVPDAELRERIAEIAGFEADVIRTLEPEPRLHG